MHCKTKVFTVGALILRKPAIDVDSEARRGAGAWSEAQRRLFLDSLFNEYDSGKLYMREASPKQQYALIDGRQRLQCIWDFADNKIALPKNFKLTTGDRDSQMQPPPKGGERFADLSEYWQETFKAICLQVALICEATPEDATEVMRRVDGEHFQAA